MNKTTLFTIVLSISLLFSCKKDDITQVKDNDYLIFGHYFRDCEGESCVETFLITDGKLYEDLSDSYYRNVHFNFVELSHEKYKSSVSLLESFPQKLLKERKHTFGCPDCYGQGGLYIAYKKDGELKSWELDSSKKDVPAYLHGFIDNITNQLAQLIK